MFDDIDTWINQPEKWKVRSKTVSGHSKTVFHYIKENGDVVELSDDRIAENVGGILKITHIQPNGRYISLENNINSLDISTVTISGDADVDSVLDRIENKVGSNKWFSPSSGVVSLSSENITIYINENRVERNKRQYDISSVVQWKRLNSLYDQIVSAL